MTGPDWSESAHPDYLGRIGEITANLRRNAEPLDDWTLYLAAHLVFVMQRVAVGRDGLAILKGWNASRIDTHRMIEVTCEYLSRTSQERQAALGDLFELGEAVKAEQGDDEFYDFDFEVAAGRECHNGLPPDDFAGLKQTSAVKALRRAVHSYRTVYPVRRGADVLSTNWRIAAAVHLRSVQ
jgi:hypothetical protein